MSIFKLKECTDEQIAEFWAWFEIHEAKLTEKASEKRLQAHREAQERLKELFPSSPETVSLTTMPKGGRWELNVSYGRGVNAKKTACRVRVMMPSSLQGKWRMEISD